jgi:parallel beta-helix repeat protein
VRDSTIWDSANRGIVIHSTNGVKVQNNVLYDIRGHGIFLEDATERRNVIEGNLVMRVRAPEDRHKLMEHEFPQWNNRGGASGFWLTNPDNTVRNNRAADSEGNGFWMAYPEKTLGISKAVSSCPVASQWEFSRTT